MKRLLFLSATLASLFFVAVWIEPSKQTITLSASEVIAVDGDTIDHGDDRYRLIGFDTPETFRAQCEAERALGLKAKDRLTEIIQTSGQIELVIQPDLDVHDRFLAVGRSGGQEIGKTLISEGLARPYSGGKRGSWCG
ncbi:MULTISPECIES: thermonuclease family protein [Ruegeria]|uniref:Thermonuclease family protein n=1 Tax=Ruegeria atlantica TaxID=81569 RepID=A0AA90Z4L0_9RHOB|nr:MULTISPECIES: thermonuclease family protein [Ruegeria]NOE20524.1 thermonuclease family protein [Ruegeria atlantica]UAB91156.1 thermonuclease family protein [Ruegeria sp. SCSIO 43209]